ncbi:hypothetical protein ACET3Z_014994 [Daucus carota]
MEFVCGNIRVPGAYREAGFGERRGDIQREQLLHVPRHQEAVLWHGGQPYSLRAGRGPQRQGHGDGLDHPAWRTLRHRAGGVCGWEAGGGHGQSHGESYQWQSCAAS